MSKDTATMLAPPLDLPPGWDSYYSAEYSRLYFVNPLTGRSTWDLPTVDIHNDKFMFPIRDRDRSIRTPLPFTKHEKKMYEEEEQSREEMRSSISPVTTFGDHNPERYVSGNFFVNIGIHFPQNGTISPQGKSFAYFKRTIKEQGIFCEKMDNAEVLEIASELFTYNPLMNIDLAKNKISDKEYQFELEYIRHTYSYTMSPSSIDAFIERFDTPKNISVNLLMWKMLLYAKLIKERCEGTCKIEREDPRNQFNPGMMITTAKQKRVTIFVCGFTAPSIAIITLFLQVMGSDFLDAFRKHSKCSVKTMVSRSKSPEGVRAKHDKKIIYSDEMLAERLNIFDKTLSVDEPRLYAKINTVINQLYDNNNIYKTGIKYMNWKRPDLFKYSGLKMGVNIVSVVQTGVTIHHSFIYNMGEVSVVMDSWAHGRQHNTYFGREMTTRIWLTEELEQYLNNLHPDRPRKHEDMKATLLRVFLAPHIDNLRYYPQFLPRPVETREILDQRSIYWNEMVENDERYNRTDYTIISINQNFLMTTFSFNFGFTKDILFGGGDKVAIPKSLKNNWLHHRSHRSHCSLRSHRIRNGSRKYAKTQKKNKK
jgi:hypothetical protein